MEIKVKYCYRLNNGTKSIETIDMAKANNINGYIGDVLEETLNNKNVRRYCFTDEQTKIIIDRFCFGTGEQEAAQLSSTLVALEYNAKVKYPELNLDERIRNGISIVALLSDDNGDTYFIFIKADHSIFIDDTNDKELQGLLKDRKKFRAFVAQVLIDKGNTKIDYKQILSFDKTSSLPRYWIEDFWHLKEQNSDEEDTKKAYNALANRELAKCKQKYPYDHTILKSMIIGEFSSDGEFDYNDFVENRIRKYQPQDPNLNIKDLADKMLSYPSKYGFDTFFDKKSSAVDKRAKDVIKLSDHFDLVIKGQIDESDNTIRAIIDKSGNKCILIRTDEGYNHFNKQKHDKS